MEFIKRSYLLNISYYIIDKFLFIALSELYNKLYISYKINKNNDKEKWKEYYINVTQVVKCDIENFNIIDK